MPGKARWVQLRGQRPQPLCCHFPSRGTEVQRIRTRQHDAGNLTVDHHVTNAKGHDPSLCPRVQARRCGEAWRYHLEAPQVVCPRHQADLPHRSGPDRDRLQTTLRPWTMSASSARLPTPSLARMRPRWFSTVRLDKKSCSADHV